MTIDELMPLLLEDAEFYETSGGGMTLSGGEPFCQAKALCQVWDQVSEGRDLIVYTGYTFEQILEEEDPDKIALLSRARYLIDGPYIAAERDLPLTFRGSRNQRIINVLESVRQQKAVTIDW